MDLNEDQKIFEERYKNAVYSKIGDGIDTFWTTIAPLSSHLAHLGIQYKPTNPYISINNKISELACIFRENGLSIYSEQLPEYKCVSTNLLGETLIFDVISKGNRAHEKMNGIYAELEFISEAEKNRQTEEMKCFGTNIFSSIFHSIKNACTKKAYTEEMENNKQELINLIQDYEQYNDKIFKYSLNEENVTAAVKDRFMNSGYSYETTMELTSDICDHLQILGLESIISPLSEEISKTFSDETLLRNDEFLDRLNATDGFENIDVDQVIEDTESFLSSLKVPDTDNSNAETSNNIPKKESNSIVDRSTDDNEER